MTKTDKLLIKFKQNPENVKFREIEKILLTVGYKKVEAKGSHKKYKRTGESKDIIIPVHNGDCKNFYKFLKSSIGYYENKIMHYIKK